jgi:hypothetical protein
MSKTVADFKEFHRENPEVYELFKVFAFEAIDAGGSYQKEDEKDE